MKSKRGQIGKRGKETKKRNSILLYAAEGDNKTETIYLNNFRGNSKLKIIKADGNDTDPVKMMVQLQEQAIELDLSTENDDQAFCLIDADTDTVKQPQIDAAVSKQSELVKVIISAPCFEEWFLCHYRYSTGYLTSAQAIKDLGTHCKSYRKTLNIFPEISEFTETAIQHAIRLEEYHDHQGHRKNSIERNPSTEMYKVVEFILRKR